MGIIRLSSLMSDIFEDAPWVRDLIDETESGTLQVSINNYEHIEEKLDLVSSQLADLTRKIEEGWVTINGNHVLIGDDGETDAKSSKHSDAQLVAAYEKRYPLASAQVSGLTVRKDVPNLDSIEASLYEHVVLKGIREVSSGDFTAPPDRTKRTNALAAEISANKEINPLIVVVDHEGPYILEGGHRYDALKILGVKTFPAVVALDLAKSTRAKSITEGWVTINGNHVLIGDDGGDEHKILLATGIYRARNVNSVHEVPALFNDKKSQAFEKSILPLSKQYDGVKLDNIQHAAGVWQSSREASFVMHAEATDLTALDAFAAKIGDSAPERQMATVRFVEDNNAKGFAYELQGVTNDEHAVSTLLKHGFDGQTVPIGSGKILLFDGDGSLHSKIDTASKELGLTYTATKGSVRFITEDEYKPVQNKYRRAKGQAEESYHRDVADLQETSAQEILNKPVITIQEGWVTINGNHVLIGDDGGDASGYKSNHPEAKHLGEKRPDGSVVSTEDLYKNKVTGEWDKAHQQLAQNVASEFIAGKTAATDRKPIAYILGGGTASGKTTASREILGQDKNVLRIDPDELKLRIKEYAELKESHQQTAAAAVHEESSYLTKTLVAKAIANKLDFTYDSTTSGNGGVQMVKTALAQGYDVHAMFVDIPVSVAKERAALRAATSNDPINRGRSVPDEVIQASHRGAAEKFLEVKDIAGLKSARLYDNTGKSARLVYERHNNGEEIIHDKARFEQYQRKAKGLAEGILLGRFTRPNFYTEGHRRIGEIDKGREKEIEEGWVTLNGNHVLIGDDGTIQKGPAGLIGLKLSREVIAKHTTKVIDSSESDAIQSSAKLQRFIANLPDTATVSANSNTAKEKAEFLKTASGDEATKTFVNAVEKYTDGAYEPLSNITHALNVKGKDSAEIQAEDAARWFPSLVNKETALKYATSLNEAVRTAPPRDLPLYRGVALKPENAAGLENLKIGDETQITGVKSFSAVESVAKNFAIKPGEKLNSYMLKVEGSVRGVPIAAISEYAEEQEFITQGRFKVTNVANVVVPMKRYDSNFDHYNVKQITLKQVGVF